MDSAEVRVYSGQRQGERNWCPISSAPGLTCIAARAEQRRTRGRHDNARCRLIGLEARSTFVVSLAVRQGTRSSGRCPGSRTAPVEPPPDVAENNINMTQFEGYKTKLDLPFLACLLALSHSGRHERTALCSLLLCAGPIAGRSAVLEVRRYCGYRSLVYAFVVCTEEAGSKTKQEKRGGEKLKEEKKEQSRDRSGKKNLPVGNYGLRRAERCKDMRTMSSEVGEI